MKTPLLLICTFATGIVLAANETPHVPVPVTPAPPVTLPQSPEGLSGERYEQRLYGPGGTLIAAERANEIVQSFRSAYERLGRPRIVFYVNRDLVDQRAGLKLTGRKEKTETTYGERTSSFEAAPDTVRPEAAGTPQTQVNVAVGGGNAGLGGDQVPGKGSTESRSTTLTGENTYGSDEVAAHTLADRLTVREVETLFGRPFRAAGARLADQKIAASLLADANADSASPVLGETARKDREALGRIADVVIEVLVSTRDVTVANVSGDKTVSLPDIQVTAVRVSDSAIIGQASAADVLGKDREAARVLNQFDAREITEATALALMDDITTSAN